MGTEKIATRAKDQLSRIGCKVHSLARNVLKSSHADSEDLMMLYQMLKPQYICPVVGEYRHQYVQKNIAMDAGYLENQIRENFDFTGTPIIIKFTNRGEKE